MPLWAVCQAPAEQEIMARTTEQSAKDRFLAFMIADIEGKVGQANIMAQEMIDLREMPHWFNAMRARLRECKTIEDVRQVRKAFSSAD
jgi:hypothetical protein